MPSRALLQSFTQLGLSLIELMVGLTIGLMLTLGLFTLIAGQSRTFKLQDDFARMQENATAALRYIGDSVRMAGFYGYAQDPNAISTTLDATVNTGGNDCGSATNFVDANGNGAFDGGEDVNWALRMQVPISGRADLTPGTVEAAFPCIIDKNFATGPGANPNPILVTRGGGGFKVCRDFVAPPGPPDCTNLNALLATQPNFKTTIYLQSDPNAGLLFTGNNFEALRGAGTTRFTATGLDLEMFEYHAHVYYIRPCSRPTSGAGGPGGNVSCLATDDDGRPIPTLVRQELVGSAMTEVPLVEGVERIDYRFGIDDLPNPPLIPGRIGDGVPDRFTDKPTAAEWLNVVAVKVTVLVRAPTTAPGYSDAGKQYDLDGDGIAEFVCGVAGDTACQYKRKVFSQIFQVRNVAQRRGA